MSIRSHLGATANAVELLVAVLGGVVDGDAAAEFGIAREGTPAGCRVFELERAVARKEEAHIWSISGGGSVDMVALEWPHASFLLFDRGGLEVGGGHLLRQEAAGDAVRGNSVVAAEAEGECDD